MDRFDAMRAFVQVVDAGSVTRAAQQLGLHKATVSQQIQQLEARLSARLLTRTTRSIAPTAEGLAYYPQALAILQQVDEAEALLRSGAGAPSGQLRVNVPVAMGRLVFAPEMRAFLERHPRLSVELGCSDCAVDLVREGVDVALRGGELPDSQLAARPVGAASAMRGGTAQAELACATRSATASCCSAAPPKVWPKPRPASTACRALRTGRP